jgi:hypothetical protein
LIFFFISVATTGSSRSVLKTNATKLVSAWLEGPPKKKDLSDCPFMGDKVLAKLFIRYNTAIYSLCYIQNVTVIVTAVEEIFSSVT